MKVYVENKDKDFLELCLKEHCVYDYIEYDSRYRDRLELVSLADHTKQVRKEVCEELKDIFNKSQYMSRHNSIDKETLFKILDQIQGETK